jgi:hypothetical protein
MNNITFNTISKKITEVEKGFGATSKWADIESNNREVVAHLIRKNVPIQLPNTLFFIRKGNDLFCCISSIFDFIVDYRVFLNEMFFGRIMKYNGPGRWGTIIPLVEGDSIISCNCKYINTSNINKHVSLSKTIVPIVSEFKKCFVAGRYSSDTIISPNNKTAYISFSRLSDEAIQPLNIGKIYTLQLGSYPDVKIIDVDLTKKEALVENLSTREVISTSTFNLTERKNKL